MAIKTFNFITVPFTDEDKEQARKHYDFQVLKNSVTKGRGNLTGALGELMLVKYLRQTYPNSKIVFDQTYDYDLIIDDIKIDVKSQKTVAKPLPHYSCGIFALNTKQDCDFYYFTRINYIQSECYLLGMYDKQQFFEDAKFRKKGEIDTSSPNNFTFARNSYQLELKQLIKLEDILNA